MAGVFVYANPGRIRWGAGSLRHLADDLDRFGVTRPYLFSTRSVLASADLMGALRAGLGGRALSGQAAIGQHAPIAQVEAAAAAARVARADCLISFGGGSAIDAAKLAGLRLAGAGAPPPPHVAIPTTLSAAELASGAGFTDSEGNKAGSRDDRALPAAVVYDPEVALHTPLQLWLSTGVRALDHAVETILAEGEHPFSDVLAREAIERLFRGLPAAREAPADVDVRADNQLAAWFSFTLPGPAAAGLSHVMGKQIGARHGIPHGVTSCILLPHVMRYRLGRDPGRAAALRRSADDVQRLIADLELPRHLSDYGLGEADLRDAAQAVSGGRSPADILEIYLQAL